MLASITPLGERSRGSSWTITAAAFALGAVVAGAVAGAAGGALGSLLPHGAWRDWLAAVILLFALVLDGGPLSGRLPSTRRQVNEDWLHRYRGWVYGVSFGAQLGAGLATVVTSAAIYATALATVLVGSVAGGMFIGAAFGATRAASLLPARAARDPAGLVAVQRGLHRWAVAARRLVVVAEVAALGLVLGALT